MFRSFLYQKVMRDIKITVLFSQHFLLKGGVIHGTLLGLEHMKRGSVIVNTSSTAGTRFKPHPYPVILLKTSPQRHTEICIVIVTGWLLKFLINSLSLLRHECLVTMF